MLMIDHAFILILGNVLCEHCHVDTEQRFPITKAEHEGISYLRVKWETYVF